MTTKSSSTTRAEQVRQRRTSQKSEPKKAASTAVKTRSAYHPQTAYLPGEPRRITTSRSVRNPPAGKKGQAAFATSMGHIRGGRARAERKGLDVGFSLGRTDVRAPVITLPHLGPRWVSGILTLVLGFMLYTMWTASTFTVSAAEVQGNQRLTADDVNNQLEIKGQPIFKAIPSEIEKNLRSAFPDLSAVSVRIGLPNRIVVDVVERQPVIAWYYNSAVTWIDANGVAFLPRGEVKGLLQVSTNNEPPKLIQAPSTSLFDQVFIAPEMVEAFKALAPDVPAGITMTYDPQYGAGWQDPRGWSVYFGQNILDIAMKLKVYQSIVNTFTQKGIQPTMISVEYLDAPFYK